MVNEMMMRSSIVRAVEREKHSMTSTNAFGSWYINNTDYNTKLDVDKKKIVRSKSFQFSGIIRLQNRILRVNKAILYTLRYYFFVKPCTPRNRKPDDFSSIFPVSFQCVTWNTWARTARSMKIIAMR